MRNKLEDKIHKKVYDYKSAFAKQFFYRRKGVKAYETWSYIDYSYDWYNIFGHVFGDKDTHPIPVETMARFHTKIIWMYGKSSSSDVNNYVIMGSRNAKKAKTSDVNYYIWARRNEPYFTLYDYYHNLAYYF